MRLTEMRLTVLSALFMGYSLGILSFLPMKDKWMFIIPMFCAFAFIDWKIKKKTNRRLPR